MEQSFRSSKAYNNNNLGFGVSEIKFFSKEIDYDEVFYKSKGVEADDKALKESKVNTSESKHHTISPVEIVKIWENGGPVKLKNLHMHVKMFPLYFRNFKHFSCDELKNLLHGCFAIYEDANLNIRATFENEEDLRIAYKILKRDFRYKAWVYVDTKDYRKKLYRIKNQNITTKIETLISEWLDKGNVVCLTRKPDHFSLQIKNYQELNYDGLVKLFSKYGKFNTIAHLQCELVQVRFSTEDAARDCYRDLVKNPHYKIKILFFLRKINPVRKLVKDLLPFEEEALIKHLLDLEKKIGFIPYQLPKKIQHNEVNSDSHRNEDKVKTVADSAEIKNGKLY